MFYCVFFHHIDSFLKAYESRFEREYGYLRSIIQEVVDKYLDCETPASLFTLSLRQRGACEILQGDHTQRDRTRHYCCDTVIWEPNEFSSALTFPGYRGRGR